MRTERVQVRRMQDGINMYLEQATEKLINEFELHGFPTQQVRPQAMLLLKRQIERIVKQYGKDLLRDLKPN